MDRCFSLVGTVASALALRWLFFWPLHWYTYYGAKDILERVHHDFACFSKFIFVLSLDCPQELCNSNNAWLCKRSTKIESIHTWLLDINLLSKHFMLSFALSQMHSWRIMRVLCIHIGWSKCYMLSPRVSGAALRFGYALGHHIFVALWNRARYFIEMEYALF